jgi:CBS domain-containing protein
MDFTAESVSKKAITIQATDSISDARDIMLKHNISRIVVVNNSQRVKNMVSDGGELHLETVPVLNLIRNGVSNNNLTM